MKNELKILAGDLERHYRRLDVVQQEKLRVLTFRVLSIGLLLTLTGTIYSYVPMLVRLFAVPLAIVGAWYLAPKVLQHALSNIDATKNGERPSALRNLLDRLKHAPTLAVLGAFMMVAFLCAGLFWGAS